METMDSPRSTVALFSDGGVRMQPVLKALHGAGIHVVALHHHMTMELPCVVFLHYWGIGSTRDLAQGLKAALDTPNK